MRIIAAEFVESAARANAEWTMAVAIVEQDPDAAMTHMANVVVQLDLVPMQVSDLLAVAKKALTALEEETEGSGTLR